MLDICPCDFGVHSEANYFADKFCVCFVTPGIDIPAHCRIQVHCTGEGQFSPESVEESV